MSVRIIATGSGIPSIRMTNEELSKRVDTTDEWIRSHTGIGNRHYAEDGQMASDLGAIAAKAALKKAGLSAADVDVIVLATATPDYFGFPSTACILQDKIGEIGRASCRERV